MSGEDTQHLTDFEQGPTPGDLDEGDECSWCSGDGFEDCDDPIQCMRTIHIGDEHECGACGGSGLAKDQTVW